LSFSKEIFTFVSITSRSFKITYLFWHNLKFKFCCQSCDVIFPLKTVKIEKQKNIRFLCKIRNGEHVQAQQLCHYLKFLSKKAIAFSTTALLQFDDEFRGMVTRGEAAYEVEWC